MSFPTSSHSCAVYTFGYLGHRIQDLMNILNVIDATVVDVRYSPRSRNPQWSGGNLRRTFGSRYVHLPEFGNVNYKSDGPIQLANPTAGFQTIEPLLRKGPIVLLCACRSPTTCHRTTVAHVLAEHFGVRVCQETGV